jgi:uncharacterized RDD family membrane protein YckC
MVILSILSFLLVFIPNLISAAIGSATSGLPEPLAGILVSLLGLFWLLTGILLPFLYFGYFWSTRACSIGMGMMNIRVVGSDDRPLSFLMAGLRGSLGYYISGLVFGLGYLWALIDSEQKTWHDMIFKTRVIIG